MNHAVEVLKTTILAVLSLAAIAASAAQASSFEAEDYPAVISGSVASDSFQMDGLAVECSSTGFSGELSGPAETLDLTPSFNHCTSVSSTPASVSTNGCVFRLHAGQSSADLVCPPGQAMAVYANPPVIGECEAEVASQNGLAQVTSATHETAESPSQIGVSFSIEGMSYSEGEATTFCPIIAPGEGGAYLSGPDLEGEFEGEATGIAVSGKTRLCEKEPVTTCSDVYAAGTQIEANEPVATFELGSITIDCQSKLSATSIEKENAPLHLKDLDLELTGCVTNEAVKCTNPTVVRGFPNWISAFASAGFDGALYIRNLELVIVCGAEVKCKYGVNLMKFSIKNEKGTPRLFAESALLKEVITGEIGCSKTMNWFSDDKVEKPKSVWITGL